MSDKFRSLEEKRLVRNGYYERHKNIISEEYLERMSDEDFGYYKGVARTKLELQGQLSKLYNSILILAAIGISVISFAWISNMDKTNTETSGSSVQQNINDSQVKSRESSSRSNLKSEILTEEQTPVADCDPNYSPCVENVSYDLDCGDIGFTVQVVGSDPHGFDGDNDGYGCE